MLADWQIDERASLRAVSPVEHIAGTLAMKAALVQDMLRGMVDLVPGIPPTTLDGVRPTVGNRSKEPKKAAKRPGKHTSLLDRVTECLYRVICDDDFLLFFSSVFFFLCLLFFIAPLRTSASVPLCFSASLLDSLSPLPLSHVFCTATYEERIESLKRRKVGWEPPSPSSRASKGASGEESE